MVAGDVGKVKVQAPPEVLVATLSPAKAVYAEDLTTHVFAPTSCASPADVTDAVATPVAVVAVVAVAALPEILVDQKGEDVPLETRT